MIFIDKKKKMMDVTRAHNLEKFERFLILVHDSICRNYIVTISIVNQDWFNVIIFDDWLKDWNYYCPREFTNVNMGVSDESFRWDILSNKFAIGRAIRVFEVQALIGGKGVSGITFDVNNTGLQGEKSIAQKKKIVKKVSR
jgi:hypothetical protein